MDKQCVRSADPSEITAIIPTIGRPESLSRLLESLSLQSCRPALTLVADGSEGGEVERVIESCATQWPQGSLKRLVVHPPNAVKQRVAAINQSSSKYLLLLDDDVVLEPDCVECLMRTICNSQDIVGVSATFNNQEWSMPTRAWRLYLKFFHAVNAEECQGRVIGPLLRFGFLPSQRDVVETEWLGSGMSLIRRDAYQQSGGFSDFFLRRCTMNEDVDLSIKLRRIGRLMFCPHARLGHFHAPSGRVSARVACEDDVYNRYRILTRTLGRPAHLALISVSTYVLIESASSILGGVRRLKFASHLDRLCGRLGGLLRILFDRK